eukprot:SAG25_NODE_1428_length_3049_cov_8.522373_4_plen_49_part_01
MYCMSHINLSETNGRHKRSICPDDGAPSGGTIVGEDTEAASGVPPRRAA